MPGTDPSSLNHNNLCKENVVKLWLNITNTASLILWGAKQTPMGGAPGRHCRAVVVLKEVLPPFWTWKEEEQCSGSHCPATLQEEQPWPSHLWPPWTLKKLLRIFSRSSPFFCHGSGTERNRGQSISGQSFLQFKSTWPWKWPSNRVGKLLIPQITWNLSKVRKTNRVWGPLVDTDNSRQSAGCWDWSPSHLANNT